MTHTITNINSETGEVSVDFDLDNGITHSTTFPNLPIDDATALQEKLRSYAVDYLAGIERVKTPRIHPSVQALIGVPQEIIILK